MDFQPLIVKATKKPILPVIMEPVFQLMSEFISKTYHIPHSQGLAPKAHRNVISLFDKKDGGRAFEAMKKHMQEAKDPAVSFQENLILPGNQKNGRYA